MNPLVLQTKLKINRKIKSDPVEFIHTLLFVIENIKGSRQRDDLVTVQLRYFITHKSGLHLLLLLLNADYTKAPVGRMPVWFFGILLERIDISNRSLRMFLKDAMSENFIRKVPGRRDKRFKVYMLANQVINAWEALSINRNNIILKNLTSTAFNGFANINYND